MSELKRDLTKLEEGKTHTAGADQYLITEDNSISDVLRFCVEQSGNDKSEVQYLLDTME